MKAIIYTLLFGFIIVSCSQKEEEPPKLCNEKNLGITIQDRYWGYDGDIENISGFIKSTRWLWKKEDTILYLKGSQYMTPVSAHLKFSINKCPVLLKEYSIFYYDHGSVTEGGLDYEITDDTYLIDSNYFKLQEFSDKRIVGKLGPGNFVFWADFLKENEMDSVYFRKHVKDY